MKDKKEIKAEAVELSEEELENVNGGRFIVGSYVGTDGLVSRGRARVETGVLRRVQGGLVMMGNKLPVQAQEEDENLSAGIRELLETKDGGRS